MLNNEVMFGKVYNIWNIAYILRYVVGFSRLGYFVPEQRKEFSLLRINYAITHKPI
jgi:hypothetical protein